MPNFYKSSLITGTLTQTFARLLTARHPHKLHDMAFRKIINVLLICK